MKFLRKKTVWSNGELGLVKSAMVSMGIVIGSYFYKYISDFIDLFFIIFIVTAILSIALWRDKLKFR